MRRVSIPGQGLQLGNHRPQSMVIKGVAVQCPKVHEELTAFGFGGRGRYRYLAAERTRRSGFAVADPQAPNQRRDVLHLARIASPEMLLEAEMLPHLTCSRPMFIGGANDEADQHGGA